jgi:hypothetical protein
VLQWRGEERGDKGRFQEVEMRVDNSSIVDEVSPKSRNSQVLQISPGAPIFPEGASRLGGHTKPRAAVLHVGWPIQCRSKIDWRVPG